MNSRYSVGRSMLAAAVVLAGFAQAAGAQAPGAQAPAADVPFILTATGRNAPLPLDSGQAIYSHICQGCHMADGKGATLSPAAYPALAGNKKLAAKVYPAMVLVNGQGAMPSFGALLNDEQIASAVNYLRTNFSNKYRDVISSTEVRALRPATQSAPTELRGR